jgi:DNA-directed RNA polymerase specialized sigma subunit
MNGNQRWRLRDEVWVENRLRRERNNLDDTEIKLIAEDTMAWYDSEVQSKGFMDEEELFKYVSYTIGQHRLGARVVAAHHVYV